MAEEYFRRSIFVPLYEWVTTDLEERLPEETLRCFDPHVFMPKVMGEDDEDFPKAEGVINKYRSLFQVSPSDVLKEYQLWRLKWRREKDQGLPIPEAAVDVLSKCDSDMFPSVRLLLLEILATFTCSNATGERSFSSLSLIKTFLRNRIGEERLNGLALMYIHKDIPVDVEHVITRYAKKGNRRKEFVI